LRNVSPAGKIIRAALPALQCIAGPHRLNNSMNTTLLLRNPLAVLPLALSTAALSVVLGDLVLHGPAPQSDEGAAAHLFQLLITAEVPIVALFLWKWLKRSPRYALSVFAVQMMAVVVALAPVLYFNL
jgi:hypothetical protein